MPSIRWSTSHIAPVFSPAHFVIIDQPQYLRLLPSPGNIIFEAFQQVGVAMVVVIGIDAVVVVHVAPHDHGMPHFVVEQLLKLKAKL